MSAKVRLYLVATLLALGLGIALTKAGTLQLLRGSKLKHLAERQYIRPKLYGNYRGDILDRKGRLLASSVSVDSVYAEPKRINNATQVVKSLGKAIRLNRVQIEKLSSDRSFIWLKRRIDPNTANKVRNMDLEGIGLAEERQRFYPNHGLLGQTLGFVSIDGQSLGGIEQAFERYLKPKSWKTLALQDARGNPIRQHVSPPEEALAGNDIMLTIDRNIQSVTEEILQKTVKKHGAKAGWAIVMKPKTGEILALANVPLMNPNRPSKHDQKARRNNAISLTREPGSTFKIMTFAAAYDLGLVKPDEKIYCEKGRWNLGYMTIKDVSKKEWLTPAEIFKYSSNIGTYKIAERIGPKRLYETIKKFGFGELPGLHLLEEAPGFVSNYKSWHKTRFANMSFGYGLMASPLQVVMMVNTIANDGLKVSPAILKGIHKHGADTLANPLPSSAPIQVISKEAAQAVKNMMLVEYGHKGSARRAAIPGMLIAGKTGTAEKLDDTGRYNKKLNISSFVGFAPANNPQIVALVSIDEPQGIAFGGYVAAPAWREVVEAALLE